MKIYLNSDAVYYKCIFAIFPIVIALMYIGFADIISSFLAYISIGIPIILTIKIIFSKWILGEQHFILIQGDKVVIHHGYRFDNPNVIIYDIGDGKILYKNIPCLEAVGFENGHTTVLYKYMFNKHDYDKLLALLVKKD